LILILIGSLPTWPYSAGWGYYPSSGLGLILVIVLILVLLGRILRTSRQVLARRFLPVRAKRGVLLAGFGQRPGVARLSTAGCAARALSEVACDFAR
jgi:hypothetical protein